MLPILRCNLRQHARYMPRYWSTSSAKSEPSNTTVDEQEISKFQAIASRWWDLDGAAGPLLHLNPLRVGYIRDRVIENTGSPRTTKLARPLKGVSICDIGCGGGLVSEPLARLGASVLGVDAAGENIKVAKQHAKDDPSIQTQLRYIHTTAEKLTGRGSQFDTVVSMEVIEHVLDPRQFIKELCHLVKPGGLLILSTLNRTPKSFLLGIIAAEYILNWVPRGTHEHSKFITPTELTTMINEQGLEKTDVTGMVYNPLSDTFSLSQTDTSINYILTARKPLENGN